MKTNRKYIALMAPALGSLVMMVGCGKGTEGTYSSNDITNNPPRAEARYTEGLQPTSSSSNAADRVYTSDKDKALNKDADNTGRNVRDRDGGTLTSGDQGSSAADRDMTRNIRRAIMDDKSLSTNAKNVKIITVGGKVTLRGPVNNDQEKQTIADLVQKVTGVTSLDNQLEVKATNQ